MDMGLLGIVLGVLGAVLAGTGFWSYIISRRKAPIEKRDADIAVAKTLQTMANEIASDLRVDYDRLAGELKAERAEREKLAARLEPLVRKIEQQGDTITLYRAAWNDLTQRWEYWRAQAAPPPRPKE